MNDVRLLLAPMTFALCLAAAACGTADPGAPLTGSARAAIETSASSPSSAASTAERVIVERVVTLRRPNGEILLTATAQDGSRSQSLVSGDRRAVLEGGPMPQCQQPIDPSQLREMSCEDLLACMENGDADCANRFNLECPGMQDPKKTSFCTFLLKKCLSSEPENQYCGEYVDQNCDVFAR